MSWGADAGYYTMVRYGSLGSTIIWSPLRNIAGFSWNFVWNTNFGGKLEDTKRTTLKF
jgi:hypothetical protein